MWYVLKRRKDIGPRRDSAGHEGRWQRDVDACIRHVRITWTNAIININNRVTAFIRLHVLILLCLSMQFSDILCRRQHLFVVFLRVLYLSVATRTPFVVSMIQ